MRKRKAEMKTLRSLIGRAHISPVRENRRTTRRKMWGKIAKKKKKCPSALKWYRTEPSESPARAGDRNPTPRHRLCSPNRQRCDLALLREKANISHAEDQKSEKHESFSKSKARKLKS